MRIDGEWRTCDDGITRPTVQAKIQAADGSFHVEFFLVDSCTDRKVLSANSLAKLNESGTSAPAGNYRTVDYVATSGAIGPFKASGLVVSMVKAKIENTKLLKDKLPELMPLIEAADVKGLLKVMLKIGP